MKIKILNWEDAVKAAKEHGEEYYMETGGSIYGLDYDWEYWGKTVEPGMPIDNFDGYDFKGWSVPSWLCEVVREPQETCSEVPKGWLCPRCGRIVSPFVNYCDCEG